MDLFSPIRQVFDHSIPKEQLDISGTVCSTCVQSFVEVCNSLLHFDFLPLPPLLSECFPDLRDLIKGDVLFAELFVFSPVQICVGSIVSLQPLLHYPAVEPWVILFKRFEHAFTFVCTKGGIPAIIYLSPPALRVGLIESHSKGATSLLCSKTLKNAAVYVAADWLPEIRHSEQSYALGDRVK